MNFCQIKIFAAKMIMNNPEEQITGVRGFRQILSIAKNPPIDKIIQSGVTPQLVVFLDRDVSKHKTLIFEACWWVCAPN